MGTVISSPLAEFSPKEGSEMLELVGYRPVYVIKAPAGGTAPGILGKAVRVTYVFFSLPVKILINLVLSHWLSFPYSTGK